CVGRTLFSAGYCWAFHERESGICLHQNLLRFTLPQREIVAANFYLNRIAERREADEFDFRADEESHFHEALAAVGPDIDFGDGCAGAHGDRCERLNGHELKS